MRSLRLFDILRCIKRVRVSFFSSFYTNVSIPSFFPSTVGFSRRSRSFCCWANGEKKRFSPILEPSLLMAFRARWETRRRKVRAATWRNEIVTDNCLNVMIKQKKEFTRKFVKQTQSHRLWWGEVKTLFFRWENQKANGLDTCVHNNTWSRRKEVGTRRKKNENTFCIKWMNEN